MRTLLGKLILAVIDPEVLGVADVDQSIIGFEAVCTDDAIQADLTPDNGL